ncbi:MFS transporter [Herbidospora cretacea]|uniref:MFS transporter n=1 Tax=Herbidospora cretacea TaxID=28444 RepID=UPI0007746AFB|nr:MFS transporter [Herbidospora cretacea]
MSGQTTEQRERPGSLWRHRDFMLLWSGETISQTGAQISLVAVPLTAITVLHAGPTEVALLTALQYAPVILITLFAGAWLDRHRRKPVLVVTNLIRFALIMLIPLSYLTDLLSLGLLYAVTFGVGLLMAVFDVAYVVYLSSLVSRDQLIEANAKLEGTYSIAQIGGPGIGGVLVQAATAPVALVANAATCLFAALAFVGIRKQEVVAAPEGERPSMRAEIADGLRAILRHRVLRMLAVQAALFNLFEQIVLTLYLLFGVRELRLGAGQLGLILTTASVGGLIGVLLSGRAAAAIGTGRCIVISMVVSAAGLVVVPFAPATPVLAVVVLVGGFVVYGFGLGIFSVHSLSVRMAQAPPELLGRITATFRLLIYGTIPIGALLAGVLGNVFGVRAAIMLGAVPLLVLSTLFWFSSVRHADLSIGGDR